MVKSLGELRKALRGSELSQPTESINCPRCGGSGKGSDSAFICTECEGSGLDCSRKPQKRQRTPNEIADELDALLTEKNGTAMAIARTDRFNDKYSIAFCSDPAGNSPHLAEAPKATYRIVDGRFLFVADFTLSPGNFAKIRGMHNFGRGRFWLVLTEKNPVKTYFSQECPAPPEVVHAGQRSFRIEFQLSGDCEA